MSQPRQLPAHVQSLAEEIIDWILLPNGPEKDSLKTFSLGLTPEGKMIRRALISALEPVLSREESGESVVIFSRFPRKTLLRLAHLALKDFCHEPQATE